jgi:hypothetical protein
MGGRVGKMATFSQDLELYQRTTQLYQDARQLRDEYARLREPMPPILARMVETNLCEWHGENTGQTTPCCVHRLLQRRAGT